MNQFWKHLKTSTSEGNSILWLDRFRENVKTNPDKIAIIFQNVHISYRQLDSWSDWIGNKVLSTGKESDFIGICLDRSPKMIAAMLGIQKAGMGYLPIDPDFPYSRISYMVKASKLRLIITEEKLEKIFSEHDVEALIIGDQIKKGTEIPKSFAQNSKAYILYTSGSTGDPKGVVISHAAFSNFLSAMEEELGVNKNDSILALTTISFDISGLEIFLPLFIGGNVDLVSKETLLNPQKIIEYINKPELTVVQATPSTWKMILQSGVICGSGKKLLCGGEALLHDLALDLLNTGADVWNLYGPTETTIWSSIYKLPNSLSGHPSIGGAIANTGLHILSEQMEPLPPGEIGELYISGTGLADGYYDDIHRTNERFLNHPVYNTRIYKTGDLVYEDENGSLFFAGRVDNQLKIRGFRIEASEVEFHLNKIEFITHSIVMSRQDNFGYDVLAAFIILNHDDSTMDIPLIREILAENLPEYMIPSVFIPMKKFPMTPNNKVDRKAFPLKIEQEHHKVELDENAPLDVLLRNLWSKNLGFKDFTDDQNFFDLGGHSLALIQIFNELNNSINLDLSIIDMIENPTIASLVKKIYPEQQGADKTPDQMNSFEESSHDIDENDEYSLAVIGMSCIVPGAKDTQEFWDLLISGESGISDLSEEDLINAGISRKIFNDDNYIRRAGCLPEAEFFDHEFFGYSPQEAKFMDPQHRIFLEQAYRALESACIIPGEYPGKIGVFAGAGQNQYLTKNILFSSERENWSDFQSMIGNQNDFLATRTAYKLNLKGPAVTVQTACSTSLVAINMAYQSLMSYQSDVALAGGVSLTIPLTQGYEHKQGSLFSPDGYCRAFDKNASGTIFGSGAGIVVLKRYEDAVKDKDPIIAKIRGISINNDGNEKIGFTAPSIKGQVDVISSAMEAANIHPEEVSYVEAHGTGTKLGDPVELSALTKAYRQKTDKIGYCGIGSVKPNVGHLDAAAGVVSLIKVLLSLQNKAIPPSINFKEPNPEMNIESSPFRVVTKAEKWTSLSSRIAAVSSFGIGGTNAHILVEEYRHQSASPEPHSFVIPITAKNEASLLTMAKEYANRDWSSINKIDLLYSQINFRKQWPLKGYFVIGNSKEFYSNFVYPEKKRKVVFLFSGQGTQYVGMGKELYDKYPMFRGNLEGCLNHLSKLVDWDPKNVLFFGTDELSQTEYTQPLLFAIEFSLARFLIDIGVSPDYLIGHSLGEFTAAAVSGAYDFKDVLAILVERGRILQKANDGAMIAVLKSIDETEIYLSPDIELSGMNSISQTVLSGTRESIDQLKPRLKNDKVDYIDLKSTKAFHSKLMKPGMDKLGKVVSQFASSPLQIPIVSNLTGEVLPKGFSYTSEYWQDHLIHPVLFLNGLKKIETNGDMLFIELGPGRVLNNLVKASLKDQENPISLIPPLKMKEKAEESFLSGLGEVFARGEIIRWEKIYPLQHGKKTNLPGYFFCKNSHWIKPDLSLISDKVSSESIIDCTSQEKKVSTVEEAIHQIWKDLLGRKSINREESFFDLGGDSLLAVELMNRINKKLQTNIRLDQFLKKPQIKELVLLSDESQNSKAMSLFELNQSSSEHSIYFLVGVQIYQPLAEELKDIGKCYGVYLPEEEGILTGQITDDNWEVGKLAKAYKEIIMNHNQAKNFSIMGLSFGGLVAYEVARLMALEGIKPRIVVMFDSLLPSAIKKNYFKLLAAKFQTLIEQRKHTVNSYKSENNNENKKISESEYILRKRESIYLAAAKKFDKTLPNNYENPVLLIKAAKELEIYGYKFLADYNWRKRIRNTLQIYTQNCKHLDILREPYVFETSAMIKKFIKEIDSETK